MMPEVEEERHQTKRRRAKWVEGGASGGTGTRQGDEAGGGGGWALCREEVICQIAFHSLLGLSAACQPGRQTLSDSPPRISTYTHARANAYTSAYAEKCVSEAQCSCRLEHICYATLITDSAIHYCVLQLL